METEIIYLIIGLIIGGMLGAGGIVIYKQKKTNIDLSSFKQDLENISKEIKGYHSKADSNQGSINQILTDMRTIETNFGKEVHGLKTVLVSGGSQKQGAWGQLVLEKILEKLGFTEGEEYETEKVFNDEEGRKRPDVIVNLPRDRQVIIDSKVSLTDWEEYVTATDQTIKENARKKHIKSLEKHIDDLSKKHYQKSKGIKSLDAVIMFTPNEQSILSLGKESRDLMDLAFSKKITLVGPVMLYFVLKTVEANWQADKQSKNLNEVKRIAEKLASQAVTIYKLAKGSKEKFEKSITDLSKILSQIQDGRGSFLGKVKKMLKIGGYTSEEPIPSEALESIESNPVETIAAKSEDKDE